MKKLLVALLVLISGSVLADGGWISGHGSALAEGSDQAAAAKSSWRASEERPKGWVAQEEQSEEDLELNNPELE